MNVQAIEEMLVCYHQYDSMIDHYCKMLVTHAGCPSMSNALQHRLTEVVNEKRFTYLLLSDEFTESISIESILQQLS